MDILTEIYVRCGPAQGEMLRSCSTLHRKIPCKERKILTTNAAAASGDHDLFSKLVKLDYPLDDDIIYYAIAGENILSMSLVYYNIKPPADVKKIAKAAARTNNPKVCSFLHKKYPVLEGITVEALQHGYIEVLDWCRTTKIYMQFVLESAPSLHYDSIQWLAKKGIAIPSTRKEKFLVRSIEMGSIKTVAYWLEEGLPLEQYHYIKALARKQSEMFLWLCENYAHKIPLTPDVFCEALQNANMDAVHCLEEKGCPQYKIAGIYYMHAIEAKDQEKVEWLIQNNYPLEDYWFSICCKARTYKIMRLLVENGAQLTAAERGLYNIFLSRPHLFE